MPSASVSAWRITTSISCSAASRWPPCATRSSAASALKRGNNHPSLRSSRYENHAGPVARRNISEVKNHEQEELATQGEEGLAGQGGLQRRGDDLRSRPAQRPGPVPPPRRAAEG